MTSSGIRRFNNEGRRVSHRGSSKVQALKRTSFEAQTLDGKMELLTHVGPHTVSDRSQNGPSRIFAGEESRLWVHKRYN